MFLTAAEIRELTGRKQQKRQAEWLRLNGWRFVLDADGRPKIMREYYERRSSGQEEPPPRQPTRQVDYRYTTGPWYAEGCNIHDWVERNWVDLHVPATELWARRIPRNDVTTIESGVYFLYDRDGDLLYVGMSVAIQNRIVAHCRQWLIPFTHVSWILVHEYVMERLEASYIHNLLPPYNVKGMPAVAWDS